MKLESLEEKITRIEEEYRDLMHKLASPELISRDTVKEAFARHAKLEVIAANISELREILKRIEETEKMATQEENQELKDMAREEIEKLKNKKGKIEEAIAELIRNLEPIDTPRKSAKGVIIEIRAGVGGEEAALFAGELFHMYTHFAQKRGWQSGILNSTKTDIGGYKEVIFEITGEDALKKLKFESGVHRVQRIPTTEKSGRIHTSAATVAVLPKAEKTDFQINPQDIRIDVFRSSGPGGQNVNKRETAVRITHIPTGIIVASQETRTQNQNRETAMEILRTQLLAKKIEEENQARREERKSQIGTGDRSEKIRTYNYPQDRVTDHRIKKSWHNIESILAGNLEPIMETLAETETAS